MALVIFKCVACSHGEAAFPECGRTVMVDLDSVRDHTPESMKHPENKMMPVIGLCKKNLSNIG